MVAMGNNTRCYAHCVDGYMRHCELADSFLVHRALGACIAASRMSGHVCQAGHSKQLPRA